MRARLTVTNTCKPIRHLKPFQAKRLKTTEPRPLKKLAVFQPIKLSKLLKQKIKDLYHLENKLIFAKEIIKEAGAFIKESLRVKLSRSKKKTAYDD